MRAQSAAVADRPFTVVCRHPDDVAEVRPESGYRLFVRFYDGTSGIVDLSDLIASPRAGVFAALRNEALFEDVSVVLGAVTWPNGLDLAPDTMYEALRGGGMWKLGA